MRIGSARIQRLFETEGGRQYGSEAVSPLEHALQCATLAQEAGEKPTLITACLLHDLGHLLVRADPHDGDEVGRSALRLRPARHQPLHREAQRSARRSHRHRRRVGRTPQLTTWVKIGADNTVSVVIPHCEMGTGVQTALAMMCAEPGRIPTTNPSTVPRAIGAASQAMVTLGASADRSQSSRSRSPATAIRVIAARIPTTLHGKHLPPHCLRKLTRAWFSTGAMLCKVMLFMNCRLEKVKLGCSREVLSINCSEDGN